MPPSDFEPHTGRFLSFAEREEIAIGRAYGYGIREIARHLGRSPSTISREVRRNAGTRGGTLIYRAVIAQWHRDGRAARPKTAKLVSNERLCEYVQDRLAGVIRAPGGKLVAGQRPQRGTAGIRPAAKTDGGPPRGVRSRSHVGCRSSSPMMS